MRFCGAYWLLGAVAMVSILAPATAPAPAVGEVQESSDPAFRLEWSKDGRKVNGYVYNRTSRYAAKMRLLVEGLDVSGKVTAATGTWVTDVPPNNRTYFQVAVPDAPSYRVTIVSYSWIQEIASGGGDRREARR
jgi:hypothetical protein